MGTTVEEIKARLNIVDILQEHMRLRRAGLNYVGLCPFHSEKTPSFSVSPDKGVWHCFGCGKGGDIFTFIMELEGLEFRDALEQLARRAGVPPRYERAEDRSRRSRILTIQEHAKRYFTQALDKSQGGRKARAYLRKRGLTPQTLADFGIGYAPFAWDGLVKALRARGFSEAELVAAGLAIRRESLARDRGVYDRFRARIMFPIANTHGDTVAFSGRIFPEGLPPKERERVNEAGKYVNSPNTAIYEKRRLLYGFDRAKARMRETRQAVILEGNVDIVLSHQVGVTNAVATCGTALGEEHLALLKPLVDEVIFAFDADSAGEAATRRALGLAIQSGLSVSAVLLPRGKDPADIIAKDAAAWPKLIEKHSDIMTFFLSQAKARFPGTDAASKQGFAEYLFEPLAYMPNRITRAHWLQQIAGAVSVPEASVTEDFEAYLRKRRREMGRWTPPREEPKPAAAKPRSFQHECEQNVLALLVRYPAVVKPHAKSLRAEYFTDEELADVFAKALSAQEKSDFTREAWEKVFPDRLPFIHQLQLRAEYFFSDPKKGNEELAKAITFLHNESNRRQRKYLTDELRYAEEHGDKAAIKAAEKAYNQFLHTLNNNTSPFSYGTKKSKKPKKATQPRKPAKDQASDGEARPKNKRVKAPKSGRSSKAAPRGNGQRKAANQASPAKGKNESAKNSAKSSAQKGARKNGRP